MNISRTNIDELNAVLTLTIEKADYESTVNETLKDYRKKANMPGFRKGMVPAGLIKKMYGKAILAEEINKILGRELGKYIADEKLQILGEPLPNEEQQKKIDFDNDETFEFVFDLGLSPVIDIDFAKVGKLPFYEIKIDDKMVKDQVEAYQNQFGEYVESKKSAEKDNLTGTLTQLDAEGNELEGGIRVADKKVTLNLIRDEKIKKSLTGKKLNDKVVFNLKKAFENNYHIKSLLDIEMEQVESLESDFSFTIEKIETFVPATINEEFYKKAFGPETEIATEEAMNERIKADLTDNLRYSSEYRFLVDTKKLLTEYVGMKLPEAFLKRWLVSTNEKITAEQVEQEFGHFVKDLEWTLIKNHLAKTNEIRVSEADVNAMAKEMAMMQFRQYGMFNVPDEYLVNYAQSILKNEEEKHRIIEKKLENLVLAFIKENAKLGNKKVSQKEFDDLFENEAPEA